jgi:hypothetical protein
VDPLNLDTLPRDPVRLRAGIAAARAMLADPENRGMRRQLRVLIEHLEVLAEAIETEGARHQRPAAKAL